jgi:hypothetical protein
MATETRINRTNRSVRPAAAPQHILTNDDLALLERLRAEKANSDSEFPTVQLHSAPLDGRQLASVRSGRGRRTEPSEFLPDITYATKHPGEHRGFKVTKDQPANYVIGQIRRACRNLDLEAGSFSIYNRAKEGFVAFVVHPQA